MALCHAEKGTSGHLLSLGQVGWTQDAERPWEANQRWTAQCALPACLWAPQRAGTHCGLSCSSDGGAVGMAEPGSTSFLIALPLFPLGKSSLPQTPWEKKGMAGKIPSKLVRSAEAEGMHGAVL